MGSQTLARHAGLDVSAATIRNILGDLEEIGLLASPHTSAGRIPTAQGYRMFVDSLVQMQPLGEGEVARLRSELPAGVGTQALLGNASELLSAMTHFVGVVSVPRREQFAFRHIDFVPLDGRRVLAILVFADNDVQNRVIEPRRSLRPVRTGAGRQLPQFQFRRPAAGRHPRHPAARPAQRPVGNGGAAGPHRGTGRARLRPAPATTWSWPARPG